MKVFQMRHASDRYQVAWLSQHRDYSIERIFAVSNFWMQTDALVGDAWTPPPVAPLDPNLPEGDFYNSDPSNFITGPRATAVLYPHLARAGELLPLPYRDKMLTLLNVTPWYDMLDEEHTEFVIEETYGTRIAIRRYAFRLGRVAECVTIQAAAALRYADYGRGGRERPAPRVSRSGTAGRISRACCSGRSGIRRGACKARIFGTCLGCPRRKCTVSSTG